MKRLSSIGIAVLAAAASPLPAAADDACATFFWTGSYRAPVERYHPHYLLGEGLGDVGMGHIVGTRIRHKWSQQAASCFASTSSNGYFFHHSFEETACVAGEDCFPGTRYKKLSERLADVREVALDLSATSPDGVYQASLVAAKASAFLVIALMENGKTSTAAFYQQLATQYQGMIGYLDLVLNVALPPSLRTDILDQLCTGVTAEDVDEMLEQCFDQDRYCQLYELYDMVNSCAGHQSGATLESLLAELTALRAGMTAGMNGHLAESAAIDDLWNQIQTFNEEAP
jgi:hypothetical protein